MSKLKEYLQVKLPATGKTPMEVLKQLTGSKKFLLESTVQHEKKGKYSFLGMKPYQEVIGLDAETVVIDLETGRKEVREENPMHYLKTHLPKIHLDIPLPFYGGAVGYIGYDVIRYLEDISPALPDPLDMPDLHFMLYEDLIVFDHRKNEICLLAINRGEQSDSALEKRIEYLQSVINKSEEKSTPQFESLHFKPEITEEAFIEKVNISKEAIARGEVLQVVVSQRMTAEIDAGAAFPVTFYEKLREANPSPYMFYIDFEDYVILGASPESLVQTTGKEMITNPIAGTRPRGKTSQEDAQLKAELTTDKKEILEHEMLVELSKIELGKVCMEKSITVPTYMAVEKYQHVMHLVSEVKGDLRENFSSLDALTACLPAGTVSGSPKRKAMEIINQLEEKKRGAYGGGIGYINFNHDLNIALTIRSLVIKNNYAHIQAGAGIVADSVPEKEYQETLNKAKSLLEVDIQNEKVSAKTYS